MPSRAYWFDRARGRVAAAMLVKRTRRNLGSAAEGITSLAKFGGVDRTIQTSGTEATASSNEAPVFILASGWRSGSTLLQRLLISSGDILIWGEPYHYASLVQRLADSWTVFDDKYPPPGSWEALDQTSAELSRQWIATLYPTPTDLFEAHRALLLRCFAEPARQRGYSRWGLKEVTYGEAEASYLKAMFPASRMVFVVRHPFAAYSSHQGGGPRPRNVTWERYPHRPVYTPRQFGTLWSRIAGGYLARARDLGALVVRYEDLVSSSATLDEIEEFTGLTVDRQIMNVHVDGTGISGRSSHGQLSSFDRRVLWAATRRVAVGFGYGPDLARPWAIREPVPLP